MSHMLVELSIVILIAVALTLVGMHYSGMSFTRKREIKSDIDKMMREIDEILKEKS